MNLVRLILALTLSFLVLPAGGFAAEPDTVKTSEESDSTEADTAPSQTMTSSQLTPWWEVYPDASDGWKFGLLRRADKGVRAWAIPVTILGGFGLATLGTGLAIELSDNFGDDIFLVTGLATMGVSASIALAAFPSLTSIKSRIRDFDDPVALHKRFRKMRVAFGWAALGTGIGGAVLGILTPLTFGIAVIPAAFMAVAAAIFGQVSLTFLVFEKKVETFVEAKDLPGRFGQGPQAPMHPQVVAASPLGLIFRF